MSDKKKIIKNDERKTQRIRFYIQVAFSLLCLWIGIEFHFFIKGLENNTISPLISRPPGVEGFLPISSLMSFYLFLASGEIHGFHPAGLFVLLGIVGISLTFSKSFCSWFCPVGFISELVGDFGKKLFKNRIKMPRFLDVPLRGLKYLLLLFFVYAIFGVMSVEAIRVFLNSPYNLMSDIKMYYFFAEISFFSLIVISSLFILSIVFRNFWCRYLCPYGALLGIIGLLSPNKIARNQNSCIDCNLCAKACPSQIKVDKKKVVISDECTTCLQCVDACPVKDTLYLKNVITGNKNKGIKAAVGIALIFISITGLGMITSNWANSVPYSRYKEFFKDVKQMGHPTGTNELRELNKSNNQFKQSN